jgi:hypothetical protein
MIPRLGRFHFIYVFQSVHYNIYFYNKVHNNYILRINCIYFSLYLINLIAKPTRILDGSLVHIYDTGFLY